MTKPRGALILVTMLVVLLASWGCGKKKSSAATNPAVGGASTGGAPPEGSPPGGPPPDGAPGRGDAKLKQVMTRIGKGPNALTNLLDQELKAEQPAWETIQPQAAEYARLATGVAGSDPPKGSKESWSQLSAAFAESAAALDKAAQARDLNAARAAQQKLQSSCMECHRQHRGGPGGRGPGGRGPGGPGGPPPG